MFKALIEAVIEWFRNQRTHDELARLTDRELADIGIYRGDARVIVSRGRDLDFLTTWR